MRAAQNLFRHTSISQYSIHIHSLKKGGESLTNFSKQLIKNKMTIVSSYKKKNSKKKREDFPGGPVVKHLPANIRDIGSAPGLGRFHILRGS